MQFDRAGQHVILRHRKPRLYRRDHCVNDLVDEGINLRFRPARDRHLVGKHYLCNRDLVIVGVSAKLFHRPKRILRRVFLRRCIPFPFDESAANRVVLLFEQHFLSGQKLRGHRIRVVEVAFGRIVNDVLQANVDRLVAELDRKSLIRLVSQAVEKQRVYGCRLFSYESC